MPFDGDIDSPPVQVTWRTPYPIRLSPVCLPLYFPILPNLSGILLAENPIKLLIFLTFPNDSAYSPKVCKTFIHRFESGRLLQLPLLRF